MCYMNNMVLADGQLTYAFADSHPLAGITVTVVYPDIYKNSEIFYSRTGARGEKVLCKMSQGTIRNGKQYPRNDIIRAAIALTVHMLVNDYATYHEIQRNISVNWR